MFEQIPGGQEQPGDLMIYGPHGSFTAGHSAIPLGGGNVFEQNADPDGSPPHLCTTGHVFVRELKKERNDYVDMDKWGHIQLALSRGKS